MFEDLLNKKNTVIKNLEDLEGQTKIDKMRPVGWVMISVEEYQKLNAIKKHHEKHHPKEEIN